MITAETKEKNYRLFLKKLQSIGLPVDNINANYGNAIMNASFTITNEKGNAYDGSLLEIILKTLTPYALKLNELLPQALQVERDSLIKVSLLHHLSKALTIIPNDNQWEIEKRGMLYKYNNDLPSLRTGMYSAFISQKCGIEFTIEEMEAMIINDRIATDEQARWHSSAFATIIRQANELTYLDINQENKLLNSNSNE